MFSFFNSISVTKEPVKIDYMKTQISNHNFEEIFSENFKKKRNGPWAGGRLENLVYSVGGRGGGFRGQVSKPEVGWYNNYKKKEYNLWWILTIVTIEDLP